MPSFWSDTPEQVLATVASRREGLTTAEANARRLPPERLRAGRGLGRVLAAQFLNPLVLLLVAAAAISFGVGEVRDAVVILGIVTLTGGVGFVREASAHRELERLIALVHVQATVRRDGRLVEIPLADLVVGDVVRLSVGATVPGDARLLEATGLHADEAPLTGESFPSAKDVAAVADDAPPGRRASAVFEGTHVVSGTCEAVIVARGGDTELGRIGHALAEQRPITAFDLSLRRFGNLLVAVSGVLVLCTFAANVLLGRPGLEAFLFAVAIAVGLVPEMLPAVVTMNLARGATRMARSEVLVKRLSSIEDFGAVDVLCADKTGTLTLGEVRLHGAFGLDGAASDHVLELAWLNATFESGYANPIDAALRASRTSPTTAWRRVGEIPYDFVRKRLGVAVEGAAGRILVVKGQVEAVLAVCTEAEQGGARVPLAPRLEAVRALHERLANDGLRTLAVAWRALDGDAAVDADAERGLVLAGLVALADPVRPDARAVLRDLAGLGVRLQLLTGDDHRVARRVWRELLDRDPVLRTGADVHASSTAALEQQAPGVDVFAELDPAQKERIVQALRRRGHVVAFLGDGVNDAPALRQADVGVSVEGAADVARESADVVLRRRELSVVAAGIREGRRTLVNTLKYVHYTTSANFGNMVSMALASSFLPFLPLLPKQILLNNLLSDIPALTLAGDAVDAEEVARPRRWSTVELRRFMFLFGALSSVFDALSFVAILALAGEDPAVFRTGWFVASLLTETLVLVVLRTQRSLLASSPSRTMALAVVGIAFVALLVPYTGAFASVFDLVPLPLPLLGTVVAIALGYVTVTEAAKRLSARRTLR